MASCVFPYNSILFILNLQASEPRTSTSFAISISICLSGYQFVYVYVRMYVCMYLSVTPQNDSVAEKGQEINLFLNFSETKQYTFFQCSYSANKGRA